MRAMSLRLCRDRSALWIEDQHALGVDEELERRTERVAMRALRLRDPLQFAGVGAQQGLRAADLLERDHGRDTSRVRGGPAALDVVRAHAEAQRPEWQLRERTLAREAQRGMP